MSNKKVELKPFLDSQRIINAQSDINRAVWASNLTKDDKHTFKSEDERDKYIISCVKAAQKDIESFLSIHY